MKASVNDYFRQNKVRILLFGLFTAFVSFLAPLKSFQLKWLIDSSSKNEAFAFQYYPDYTGNILFNGRQVREISRQNFYKHVGYIAQSAYLFNDTIRNNICLLESFSDGQLRHAINSAGLTEWIASLPDGLDTMISENGKNLSGGQRQRIGIARLTLRKYDLIIADEITASLDPETSQQVMDNLLTMSCMVIAITHDVSDTFMQRFDKIYQISSGIITSEQRGV